MVALNSTLSVLSSNQPKFIVGFVAETRRAPVPIMDHEPVSSGAFVEDLYLNATRMSVGPDATKSNFTFAYWLHSAANCFTFSFVTVVPLRNPTRRTFFFQNRSVSPAAPSDGGSSSVQILIEGFWAIAP